MQDIFKAKVKGQKENIMNRIIPSKDSKPINIRCIRTGSPI